MKNWSKLLLPLLFLVSAQNALSQERATKDQAVAMVAKGIAALKAKGPAVYADMTAPSKTFVEKDLYLVVYDMNGKPLAHGQNASQVGKKLDGFERSRWQRVCQRAGRIGQIQRQILARLQVHRPFDQNSAAQTNVL